MKRLLCLILLGMTISGVCAQQIDDSLAIKMQNILDKYILVNPTIKGVSAALITNEGDTWTGVAGISHGNVMITDQTLFVMASVTKTYVASIIMQLYQEDSLDLNDPLHYYVPSFDYIDSNITIKQLLNHTSGIYDFVDHPTYEPGIFADGTKWWTPEEVLQNYVNPPYFAPGAGFHYSNSGYLLLGMIIEQVTGNTFAYELQQRILIPNNLDTTFFWPWMPYPYYPSHAWYTVQGVLTDISGWADTSSLTASYTAGANLSTPMDLARWIKALMEGNVLDDSCLALMMTPTVNSNYGMGISSRQHPFTGNWCYGHSGNNVHKTAAYYVPADSLTLVVMLNTEPISPLSTWDNLYKVYKAFVTGLTDNCIQPEFSVYPNPVSDILNIEIELVERAEVSFGIYDIQGRLISDFGSDIYDTGTYRKALSISYLQSGVYLLCFRSGEQQSFRKIVKQ